MRHDGTMRRGRRPPMSRRMLMGTLASFSPELTHSGVTFPRRYRKEDADEETRGEPSKRVEKCKPGTGQSSGLRSKTLKKRSKQKLFQRVGGCFMGGFTSHICILTTPNADGGTEVTARVTPTDRVHPFKRNSAFLEGLKTKPSWK